jgi:hypothetical protein
LAEASTTEKQSLTEKMLNTRVTTKRIFSLARLCVF